MDQTRKLQNSHSIAILGYGREGRAAIEYATEHLGIKPESLTVLDTGLPNRPENLDARIGFVGGINAFLNLS
ncbi:MAG TPA: hypothetical protein PK765_03195 [bacterium]|nr:hypothetical protein [bacterium]